ncbi:hypothetical protein BD414DRAFT_480177 [Trametes punicea]|nr:hypothetical protein BD414DRAFT_480177 [Trametes punicea]
MPELDPASKLSKIHILRPVCFSAAWRSKNRQFDTDQLEAGTFCINCGGSALAFMNTVTSTSSQ